MAATNVLVRVQAKGGKFLGPDAGYSRVTITDVGSGTVLARGRSRRAERGRCWARSTRRLRGSRS